MGCMSFAIASKDTALGYMLSVFDLDHTLLKVNASFEFGRFLYVKEIFSTTDMLYLVGCYARHKLFGLSLTDLHQKIFKKLFHGRFLTFFTPLLEEFIDDKLESLIDQKVLIELQIAQKNKHIVVLLSNSPHFIIEQIAKRFDISIFAGTEYLLDSSKKFYSIGTLMEGNQKAKFVDHLARQLNITSEEITAYSDSHLDLPLLELAGKTVAVRPTATLQRICRKKNWTIL